MYINDTFSKDELYQKLNDMYIHNTRRIISIHDFIILLNQVYTLCMS